MIDGHKQDDGFELGLACGHPNIKEGELCGLCNTIVSSKPKVLEERRVITLPQRMERKMETGAERFSDMDLAELADWAELSDRSSQDLELKKAYGAIRQGADWLLRWRAKDRDRKMKAMPGAQAERPQ